MTVKSEKRPDASQSPTYEKSLADALVRRARTKAAANVMMGLLFLAALVAVVWGSCSVWKMAGSMSRIVVAVESIERKVVTGK